MYVGFDQTRYITVEWVSGLSRFRLEGKGTLRLTTVQAERH